MLRSVWCSAVVVAMLTVGLAGAADKPAQPQSKQTQPQRRPSDLVYLLIEMSDCDQGCQGELQHIYDVLRTLDKNKNGKIDPDELNAMRHQLIEQRADYLIKDLDTNKDGKISRSEAKGQIKKDFDRIDVNKDGFIERDELIQAISAKPLSKLGTGHSSTSDRTPQKRSGIQ